MRRRGKWKGRITKKGGKGKSPHRVGSGPVSSSSKGGGYLVRKKGGKGPFPQNRKVSKEVVRATGRKKKISFFRGGIPLRNKNVL